jgi:glutathione transport system substrate-binding protein
MISPTRLKQWGNKDIAFHPVGTGPFKFVEWKATDYLKVAKFDGYWRKGYPKVDSITWKPVVDNNSRAALMQTGEAHFTFPVPYELADVLKGKPDIEVVAAPSIVLRYLSMNTQQKAIRQSEGPSGDRLCNQQRRARQSCVQRVCNRG